MDQDIVYRIDAKDRIVSIDPGWDEFAASNGAPALRTAGVLGRPLWDFVSDATTRLIYRGVLSRARAGARVSFPLRCDSATVRRSLEITAGLDENGWVVFRSRTVGLDERARPLPPHAGPGTDGSLRMCGWCKKVATPSGWREVEEAIEELGLFGAPRLPLASHGICEACAAMMSAQLEAAA